MASTVVNIITAHTPGDGLGDVMISASLCMTCVLACHIFLIYLLFFQKNKLIKTKRMLLYVSLSTHAYTRTYSAGTSLGTLTSIEMCTGGTLISFSVLIANSLDALISTELFAPCFSFFFSFSEDICNC